MLEENLDSFVMVAQGVGRAEAGEEDCQKFYAKSLMLQFYTGIIQCLSIKTVMRLSNEDLLLQI